MEPYVNFRLLVLSWKNKNPNWPTRCKLYWNITGYSKFGYSFFCNERSNQIDCIADPPSNTHTHTHIYLLAMCNKPWEEHTTLIPSQPTHWEDNKRLLIQQPSAVKESLYPNTLLPRSEEVGLGCTTITKRNESREINGAERLNTLQLSTQNTITQIGV